MSHLVLPQGVVPTNLRIPPGSRAIHLESDVYGVCEQLREIDPSLYVVVRVTERNEAEFIVMEDCRDGVHRLVFKTDALDGRVLTKLRRLMAKPLDERLRELEAMEHKYEADRYEEELDRLYEDLGRPMWTQLEHDGFIETRGVSFPKRGVAAPKRAR